MLFTELGLCDELLRAIGDQGYLTPTPIQLAAIPAVLAGQDLLAAAQTGTGKTAAFTLPMLQKLKPHASNSPSPARHPVRAVILTPTRELADQVSESVQTYSQHLPLRSAVVFGGVAMPPQTAALRAGVEIVIATPGRLLDHLQQKNLQLGQVEFLVLDEADRMLDMGFINDIRYIMGLLPKNRQTLLFSATFSTEIKALADQLLQQPVIIEVARQNATSENITQWACKVESDKKLAVLTQWLRNPEMQQVLVFARTKQSTEQLARALVRAKIDAVAIHGDKLQSARLEALSAFKEGRARVLVATDVAARGLDISDLPHVVNYELPSSPEDYVHRIGRTGRAGAKGEAMSLVAPSEEKMLGYIEKLIQKKLDIREIQPPKAISPEKKPAAATLQTPPAALLSSVRIPPISRGEQQIAALFLPPRRTITPSK